MPIPHPSVSFSTAIEHILPAVIKAVANQLFGAILDVRSAKNRSELPLAVPQSRLSGEQLHHFPHRHSRRESVRIHDHVRVDSRGGEGEILLSGDQPDDSFLSMAR